MGKWVNEGMGRESQESREEKDDMKMTFETLEASPTPYH